MCEQKGIFNTSNIELELCVKYWLKVVTRMRHVFHTIITALALITCNLRHSNILVNQTLSERLTHAYCLLWIYITIDYLSEKCLQSSKSSKSSLFNLHTIYAIIQDIAIPNHFNYMAFYIQFNHTLLYTYWYVGHYTHYTYYAFVWAIFLNCNLRVIFYRFSSK
jgi:hypothetical protein